LSFRKLLNRIEIGKSKEKHAKCYLEKQGLEFVEANFHTRFGEIDIVMFEPIQQIFVFVEVRYRSSKVYGGAAASVNITKQTKLKKAALFYLAERKINLGCRFDVIAIEGKNTNWIPNAFI
jgi:putative endonuclease